MPPNVDLLAVNSAQVPWHDYWRGRRPNHGSTQGAALPEVAEALTLISMATRSYYHWVMEALCRLLAARKLLAREVCQGAREMERVGELKRV